MFSPTNQRMFGRSAAATVRDEMSATRIIKTPRTLIPIPFQRRLRPS